MTYQVFCQSFAPGSWKWTSKDPAGVGMRLDGAFRSFAALVNALPSNASTPRSVVRSHADATANRWGYTWQLGHPVEPAHPVELPPAAGHAPDPLAPRPAPEGTVAYSPAGSSDTAGEA